MLDLSKVSIVIPSKEKIKVVGQFISGNLEILNKYPLIVIDSEGGEGMLRFKCKNYLHINVSMAKARSIGYVYVNTPYTLNLDIDTILPDTFVKDAVAMMEYDPEVGVVAIDYEVCQGHYAFGASLWRTGLLKHLYDYDPVRNNKCINICECIYMWRRVRQSNHTIETLPYRAIHIKGV